MKIKSLTPLYGVNYKIGYIGFTFDDASIVSHGIAYFTRWTRMSDIKVSHALVVAGKNICIEALMGQGVAKQPLTKYFFPKTALLHAESRPANCARRRAAGGSPIRQAPDRRASHARLFPRPMVKGCFRRETP